MSAAWSPVRFIGSFTENLPAPTLPEVAFAGRSNAGKSSALNVLLGAGVARVSSTPGRTQAINLFSVNERWIAADLPGYGYAKVSHSMREQWRGLIEDYLSSREHVRLVVVLVDGRLPPQALDMQLLEWLDAVGRPSVVLATKTDALPRSKRARALTELGDGLMVPEHRMIAFSAREDIGWEPLRKRIRAAVRPEAG
jgi:GTP-binding protein